MNKVMLVSMLLLCTVTMGCFGYTSKENEVVGQVKQIQHITPFFFPSYYIADISMGVVRNGVGSMSKDDIFIYIPNEKDLKKLRQLSDSGSLVRVTYNEKRFSLFYPNSEVVSVETLK